MGVVVAVVGVVGVLGVPVLPLRGGELIPVQGTAVVTAAVRTAAVLATAVRTAAVRGTPVLPVVLPRVRLGGHLLGHGRHLRIRVPRARVHAELFDRGATAGAGEGAIQVPSARVAVVHDAGRLRNRPTPFLAVAVKVMCGTGVSGLVGGVKPGHSVHPPRRVRTTARTTARTTTSRGPSHVHRATGRVDPSAQVRPMLACAPSSPAGSG
ncbi:hypothetical protein EJ357_14140 [Streptomyces cyaneochromogenes]|uniref:Uncharacterized protein n=1 Tax=Streptomyces cyaneochromogenes TaxID=2496836 RepID=A0A3S9M5K5_9ACTN|nr:hypothetical protein EJ357_14140 [Streptomyces cyaneochromogenes]